MDPNHLNELIELEDSYWWHVAKRKLVLELLERSFPPPGILVEGGIGSARNLVEFQSLGYHVEGLDILPAAVTRAKARGVSRVTQHDLSEPWPLAAGSVKVALLLDVLEHLPDPVRVLQNIHAVLEPHGGAIITVPAYQWLYSDWDRRLGHYRRYTPAMVRREALEAGFQIEWLSHWNSFTLPAAIAVRGYQRCLPRDRKPEFPRVSPVVNRFLSGLATCERRWLRSKPAPFGLSLVGVLRK